MFQYIEKNLTPFLCGYRKGFSTQTALLGLVEKWKASLDKNGYARAVLMDLLKAFDTINHELLLAKLNAYGFDKNSLEIMRILVIPGKEQRLIQLLVLGLYYLAQAQFWDQFCLIFF